MVLGFYYGSYMDPDVLRRFGANPGTPRLASLLGWRLAFTPHANLIRAEGLQAHGVMYDLLPDELEKLYGPDGYVTTYKPVAVVAAGAAALTFVEDAVEAEADGAYVASLRTIMQKVGLPADYIAANCP